MFSFQFGNFTQFYDSNFHLLSYCATNFQHHRRRFAFDVYFLAFICVSKRKLYYLQILQNDMTDAANCYHPITKMGPGFPPSSSLAKET